jgi:hypothetical protein
VCARELRAAWRADLDDLLLVVRTTTSSLYERCARRIHITRGPWGTHRAGEQRVQIAPTAFQLHRAACPRHQALLGQGSGLYYCHTMMGPSPSRREKETDAEETGAVYFIERGEYVLQDATEERLRGEVWRWAWTIKGQGHGVQAELDEQEGGHFALLIDRAELFTRGNWQLAPTTRQIEH